MLKSVISSISKNWESYSFTRTADDITGITIHHVGGEVGRNLSMVADWYAKKPEHTGGHLPYTFGVNRFGSIEQGLPIRVVAPHALRWNVPTISVVLFGTFETKEPDMSQLIAAKELCAELCLAFEINSDNVRGHDELKEATKTPNKKCPGTLVDMNLFRFDINRYIRENAIQRLSKIGVLA